MAHPLRSIPPNATKDVWRVVGDPARLRALADTGLLEDPAPSLDRFTRVLAQVTQAKVVTISLVDESNERLVSSYGVPDPWFETGEVSLQHSFAKWVVCSGHPLIVEDAKRDPLLAECEPVLGWGVVSYAGHPVRIGAGHTVGAVAVMDTAARRWSMSELNLLREVAASVITEVRAREAKRALVAKGAVLDAMLTVIGQDVAVYDAGGRLVSSNRAQPRTSARARTVVPLAREPRLSEGRSGPSLPPSQTPLARALLGERTSQEWFVRDADTPQGRWCHIAATPVADAHGRLIGAVVVTSGSSSDEDDRSSPSR